MAQIYSKLAKVQIELKAPKTQFNKFGGYHYRKAEDILEAVKPILVKHGLTILCTDDLVSVNERYYVKASAILVDTEDGESITVTAFAREEEDKKGMDGSQITGASSSYARKYAMNGLFAIDDTADSDTTNQGDTAKTDKADKADKKVQKKEEKPAVPARGSEEWKKWVAAVATGWKSKKGYSAQVVFAAAFDFGEQDKQEVIGCLEEDAFNYKLDNNVK